MWWNCKGNMGRRMEVMRWLECGWISEMMRGVEYEGVLGDFFYFVNPELMELYPLNCHNNYSYCDVNKESLFNCEYPII